MRIIFRALHVPVLIINENNETAAARSRIGTATVVKGSSEFIIDLGHD